MSARTAKLAAQFWQTIKNNPLRTAGVVGAGGGLTVAALTPTLDSKNNKGNITPPPAVPSGGGTMPPGSSANETPSASAEESKTPSIQGAGESDFLKGLTLEKLLELTEASSERSTARNIQAQLILGRELEEAALRKSRELSAREIEKANIEAWRSITAEQYRAQSAIALGMADVAYRATQANPATLTATAPLARIGMEAFKGA